jgi:hypothetical protein
MEDDSHILAFVAQEPLQSCLAWTHQVDMGTVPSHWRASVSLAYIVEELPRPLAPCPLVLEDVEKESLLQVSPMVLGPMEEDRPPSLQVARAETMDWKSMGQGSSILASRESKLLSAQASWTNTLDLGSLPETGTSPVSIAHLPEELQWPLA